MPVIPHKAKTATSVPLMPSVAPSLDSLINTSDAEFLARTAEHRKALRNQIDRRTTAAMLGISVRTLDRWHRHRYGPKRLPTHPIRYLRSEVEAWVAEHGRGIGRPRSTSKCSVLNPAGHDTGAIARVKITAKGGHEPATPRFEVTAKS
jgi:hypothetical protein